MQNKNLWESRQEKKNFFSSKLIDLHGFTLDEANKLIEKFIVDSYSQGINKLIVVTGKGLHSQNEKDPYTSKEFGISHNDNVQILT